MSNRVRSRNGDQYDFEDGIKIRGEDLDLILARKQEVLVSGQTLKTIKGISLLGEGDIGGLGSDGITLLGSGKINPSQTNTYTITNYDSFDTYVITASDGVLTNNGETFTLFAPANITANAISLTITKGDIVKTYTIGVGTAYVNAPAITSPTQGQTGFGVSGPFTTGAFTTTPANVDAHELTDWQFSLSPDFTVILHQSTGNTQALTSYNPPAGALPYLTVMYVRARHRGFIRGYSDWSSVRQFTTRPEISIVTPSVSSPSASQTNVSVVGPFISSAFATANGTDTHFSSDWQFSTSSSFTIIAHQSLNNTQALTSYSPPAGALNNSTVYYVRVRHRGAVAAESTWSAGVQFTTIPPLSVDTPVITSPSSGLLGASRVLTVSASAFAVQNGTDTHASSSWQFSTSSTFSTIFHESLSNLVSKTSYTVPTGALNPGTLYYVRVRYTSGVGVNSNYSTAVNFTTLMTNTPTITVSGVNPIMDPTGPFTSSNFSSTGSDTHASTDWQFSKTSAFTVIEHESIANTTAKTSYSPPAGALAFDTTYYVRVRHNGTNGGLSAYSPEYIFKVRPSTSVATPSIVTPVNNAVGVSLTSTFTTSEFATINGADTHLSSDWQISTNTAFTNIAYQLLDSNVSKNSLTLPTNAISANTTYYLRVRHKGNNVGVSPYSPTVTFTTLKTNTPSITSPVSNSTSVDPVGSFVTTAFSSTGTDTYASSHWRFFDATETNLLHEVMTNVDSANSYKPPAGALLNNTQYAVQVRHLGTTGGYSAWSTVLKFTTRPPTSVTAPTISAPTNNAVGVSLTPTLTSSSFTTANGSDTHTASDWQISTSSAFTVIAAESNNSTTNLVQWIVPSSLLTAGTVYYARVRHRGNTSGYSAWSTTVQFTTLKTNAPTISSPANNATGVSVTPTVTASAFNSTGTDTHLNTTWQFSESASFATITHQSPNDTTNKTSYTVPTNNLLPGKLYYMRVAYNGTNGGSSDWSVAVSFTTESIAKPSITSPTNNATGVHYSPTITASTYLYSGSMNRALASSKWQWSTNPATISSNTVDITGASTSWTPDFATLVNAEGNFTVYVRVQHVANGLSSEWSDAISFTIGSIAKPSITSPTSGATAVTTNGFLQSSAFSATMTPSITHGYSRWQISTSSTFVTTVVNSLTTELTSFNYSGQLQGGTTYYARVLYTDSANKLSSAWSNAISFTTLMTNTPSVTSPSNGATGVDTAGSFTTSSFSSTGTDTHLSTDWQWSTNSTFASVDAESRDNVSNKTSFTMPAGILAPDTLYYMRVRHKGNNGGYSAWSPAISFTTKKALVINTPSITSPSNGAAGVSKTPTITSSAFSVTNGTDSHRFSDWQISTNSSFSGLTDSATGASAGLTSYTVPNGVLIGGTTYYVRVRHNGVSAGYSQWSSPSSFTTIMTNTPSITSPSNGATGVDIRPTISGSAFSSTGSDSHVGTELEVNESPSFTGTGFSTNSGGSAATSLTINGPLKNSTTYYARMRYTGSNGGVSAWSSTISFTTVAPSGQASYYSAGTYTFTVPAGVTSISIGLMGGGGGGGGGFSNGGSNIGYAGGGGGGAGFGYRNNLAVTPGNSFTVKVGSGGAGGGINANGSDGTPSEIRSGVSYGTGGYGGGGLSGANGGTGGFAGSAMYPGSAYGNSGGTSGGAGGNANSNATANGGGAGGGGGAAGWNGNGGKGGNGAIFGGSTAAATGSAGTANGAGGGGGSTIGGGGGGGGGCGFLYSTGSASGGTMSDGGGGVYTGTKGSAASNANGAAGGLYGGGGGGGSINAAGGAGASGFVRIIWTGTSRQFPSTADSSFV